MFFIFSNYVHLAGLLSKKEISFAFLEVIAWLLAVFLILLFFYKNKRKAAFVATIGGVLFLFFGNIKDMLTATPVLQYISSYTVLLFTLPAAAIFILYRIHKVQSLANTTFFLNTLFIIYIAIELLNWQKLSTYEQLKDEKGTALHSPGFIAEENPDIYYIVLDGYPSSSFQQEKLFVVNNFLDSNLKVRNFHITKNPVSNYNYTVFSIASEFSLGYINWLKGIKEPKPAHFSKAAVKISNAPALIWLREKGYTIKNLSFFNLPGSPAVASSKLFFWVTPEIIFRNTLWNRVRLQIIPSLFPSYIKTLEAQRQKQSEESVTEYKIYNSAMLDSITRVPAQKETAPKFIYVHFEMPHWPYLYDSAGKPYTDIEIQRAAPEKIRSMYSNYIGFVNNKITGAIDSILLNNKRPPVIILQSDHGNRDDRISIERKDVFRNYSAFYFPDKDYSLLYDGMSNVNTFRIIFNKYFRQQLPLLKDSSTYLTF